MTFSEAAMIMMSGGSKVIQPLSVTENGEYEVPKGVDGYNPVNVNVDDRYDEGYQDGYSQGSEDTRTEILTNPDDPTHIAIHDEGYQDGYNDGYSDGFEFASNAFGGVVDENKLYTAVMDLSEPVSVWNPGLNWIMVRLYYTSDLNTELSHNNTWPTNQFNCYYAKIIKLWWGSSNTLHYQLRSYNSDKTVEYRPEGNTIGTPIAWYSCNNANTNVIVKY